MASNAARLVGRARALSAERDRLVAEVADEWATALRNQPLTAEDLAEFWDGLTEEAVGRLRRQANGRWSPKAIRDAATQVVRAVREKVQRKLRTDDRMELGDPPGEKV